MEGEQVEAPQGNGEEVVVVLGKVRVPKMCICTSLKNAKSVLHTFQQAGEAAMLLPGPDLQILTVISTLHPSLLSRSAATSATLREFHSLYNERRISVPHHARHNKH